MFSRVLRANRYSKISRFRRFTKTIKKKSPTIKHRSAALLQLSIPLAFHLEQRYKSLSFSQEFGIERKKILLVDSIFLLEQIFTGGIFDGRDIFIPNFSKPRRISRNKILHHFNPHFTRSINQVGNRLLHVSISAPRAFFASTWS